MVRWNWAKASALSAKFIAAAGSTENSIREWLTFGFPQLKRKEGAVPLVMSWCVYSPQYLQTQTEVPGLENQVSQRTRTPLL